MMSKPRGILSGERLGVWYRLSGDEDKAHRKAQDICLEQTVELPAELLPDGDVRDHLPGRIESFTSFSLAQHEALITYPVESVGTELTQLLNVVFGNSSMMSGIRVQRLALPQSLLQCFQGPRFGRQGLRRWLGVSSRAILCAALKPLGLSAAGLADVAYQLALGGMDIVKDDHGLANQPFAPYEERLRECARAVAEASDRALKRCIYVPNVTAPAGELLDRALLAKEAGAGGLLVAPGLTGWDAMRQLAEDERIALPIISHPSMLGSLVVDTRQGMSHYVVFGQLARLAGADAAILANFGGRFPASEEQCRSAIEGTEVPMTHIRPIFPVPGGGMRLDKLADTLRFYGREVILLMGTSLYRQEGDLADTCRMVRRLVDLL
jgi:ribulose-bisphosphate carboxylase large chain